MNETKRHRRGRAAKLSTHGEDGERRGRVMEGWGGGGMKHSNSDNKRCRRMRGIKLSAVGECAE